MQNPPEPLLLLLGAVSCLNGSSTVVISLGDNGSIALEVLWSTLPAGNSYSTLEIAKNCCVAFFFFSFLELDVSWPVRVILQVFHVIYHGSKRSTPYYHMSNQT